MCVYIFFFLLKCSLSQKSLSVVEDEIEPLDDVGYCLNLCVYQM